MLLCLFFFFNATATTEIYTLSLHDALPIRRWADEITPGPDGDVVTLRYAGPESVAAWLVGRSEEHTSELQSRRDLVCRLLLEKKKNEKYRLQTTLYYSSKGSFFACLYTPYF